MLDTLLKEFLEFVIFPVDADTQPQEGWNESAPFWQPLMDVHVGVLIPVKKTRVGFFEDRTKFVTCLLCPSRAEFGS